MIEVCAFEFVALKLTPCLTTYIVSRTIVLCVYRTKEVCS